MIFQFFGRENSPRTRGQNKQTKITASVRVVLLWLDYLFSVFPHIFFKDKEITFIIKNKANHGSSLAFGYHTEPVTYLSQLL